MSGEENILKLVGVEDSEPDVYRLSDQIGFLLRKAHQRHVALFAAAIPEMTPPQFAALAMLKESGPTAQNQLGQLIAMDAATIKGVVDRLKGRGLVAVGKDEGDKRRLTVSLTGEGETEIARLIPIARQISQGTLEPVADSDRDTLVSLLARLG